MFRRLTFASDFRWPVAVRLPLRCARHAGAAKQQPSMPRSGRPVVDPDVLMHTIAARAHVDHPRLRQVELAISNRALHRVLWRDT
jgi:hypothetical protein